MISRLLHLSILCILSVSMMLGQQDSNQLLYKRFEGDTDSISMQANIIQHAEKLRGNYEVSAQNLQLKTIEIEGYINNNDVALINHMGDDHPVLKGVFVDDRFTGIWHPGENGKAIELFELYPEGSMPLSISYLHSETNLVDDDPNTPTAEIELSMIYPDSAFPQADVKNRVEGKISNRFIKNEITQYVNPDSILISAEKAFFTLYKEQNADWHEGGNSFGWMKETTMSVSYNSNYILCLEYLDYVYTGGAHGMTKLSYDIIDLRTGREITVQDIFNKGTFDELTTLLTAQLRLDQQIPDSVPLKNAGYFVDAIEPGKGIYMNGSGVGFVYNQYEIAPYSTGIVNIFLRYDQLKELIDENSAIYTILEKY